MSIENKAFSILLVDDNRLILSTLKEGLEQAGFTISACESVDEAETWLEENERPNLVLLDLNMPGRSGVELAKYLSEKDQIPFLMLTAFSDEETIKEVNDLGAVGYLVKPVSVAQIIPAIETGVKRGEEIRKLRYNQKMLQVALDGDRSVSVAIGIVMDRHNLNQNEAFELIRKRARSNHLKLIEVANDIIEACDNLSFIKKPSQKSA
jgi:response regulator NasT